MSPILERADPPVIRTLPAARQLVILVKPFGLRTTNLRMPRDQDLRWRCAQRSW
jgi:hypothetical protein